MKALAVETALLREYVAQRQNDGAAPATINRELEPLGGSYRLAVDDRRLSYSPKLPAPLTEENTRMVFFSSQQASAVLERLRVTDPLAWDFYSWLRGTGMRPKSIASLKWESFDAEEWALSLFGKDDKSRYGRPIPLEGELRTIIERRLKARLPGCPWIFHRGGRRVQPDKLRDRVFYPTLKALEIPTGKDGFRPYDLKRTGLREFRRSGAPEELAMRFSGHKTSDTFRRYNLDDLDDLRGALRQKAKYVARRKADDARLAHRGGPASLNGVSE